jgi:hypothetical protein
MEGRRERVEPLDRAHDLWSLGREVEAVARGDRSMQQCRSRCSAGGCRRAAQTDEAAYLRPEVQPVVGSPALVAVATFSSRGDLTNAEWERLRPLLPLPGRRGGRWRDHR